MKKYIMAIISILVLVSFVFISINLNKNNVNIGKNSEYNLVKNEKLIYCKTSELEETSKQAVDKLENGKYVNLTTDSITPIVKNNISISRINIKDFDFFLWEDKQKEALDEHMRILEYYLGSDIYNSYLYDNSTSKSYDEVKEMIRSGEYEVKDSVDIPGMVYNGLDYDCK